MLASWLTSQVSLGKGLVILLSFHFLICKRGAQSSLQDEGDNAHSASSPESQTVNQNQASFVTKNGIEAKELSSKAELAEEIIEALADLLKKRVI